MTGSNLARGSLGRVNDRACPRRPAQRPDRPITLSPSNAHSRVSIGPASTPPPPGWPRLQDKPRPRPAPRGRDAVSCVHPSRGLPGPQCGPSVTPRVSQRHPVPFHRRTRGSRGPGGGGGPGRLGAGARRVPSGRGTEVGAHQPGAPRARPRAGSRRAAAARSITPLAAARRVPGRSPDAHWPGRRSQAVSPCGVSARGRPRLNRVGAGLEGARETAAVRSPLLRLAPSSLSAARPHCRPRPDQVPTAGPGWGPRPGQRGRAPRRPPTRIL